MNNAPCNWELPNLPIRAPGGRPQEIITTDGGSTAEVTIGLRCTSGHSMNEGYLMCLVCGADAAVQDSSLEDNTGTDLEQPVSGAILEQAQEETQIEGWRLVRRISSKDVVRERYICQHRDTNRQAVLTLYRSGSEPDPAVYDVIGRLPREHVPEIIATGRWDAG